jgi:hypothetical protein
LKVVGVVLAALLFVVPPAFADTVSAFPSEIQVTLSNIVLSDVTFFETFSASFDMFTNFACVGAISEPVSTCGYIPLSISSSGALGSMSFGFDSTDLQPMGQVTGFWGSETGIPFASFTDFYGNQIDVLFVLPCLGNEGLSMCDVGFGPPLQLTGSFGTFPLGDPNSTYVTIESWCGGSGVPCPPTPDGSVAATSGTITFSPVPEPSGFVLLAIPLAFILLTVPKKNFA